MVRLLWLTAERRKARRNARGQVHELLGYTVGIGLFIAMVSLLFLDFHGRSEFQAHGSSDSRVELGYRMLDSTDTLPTANNELFPTSAESCADTPSGYAALFFVLTLYTFVGLAVITDEYFEPTLAIISEDLKLSPDVAGATFMAAGSSAPELLISIVDAFISKASVGVGTILGSAMFNLLVIVGGSALIGKSRVDGGPLIIQGYALGRDCIFYLVSLILLSYFLLNDGEMCVLAGDKFFVVDYNESAYLHSNQTIDNSVHCFVGIVSVGESIALTIFYFVYVTYMRYNQTLHLFFRKNLAMLFDNKTRPDPEEGDNVDGIEKEDSFTEEEEEFPGNPFSAEVPASVPGKVYHFLAFPFRAAFYFTMPISMKEGMARDVVLFLGNIFWITVLTFAMVYCGTFCGCLLKIDPFIIGVILLAVGTSVPDALASFIVARAGHGDMAVSNALGSNVFNIYLGLGLPWFVSSLAFPGQIKFEGGTMNGNIISTNGLVTGMIMLLIGTIIFVGSLVLFKWRLQRTIAALLISYFAVFVILTILSVTCQIDRCVELECFGEDTCNSWPLL